MAITLGDNYFTVFNIPEDFHVDFKQLASAYRELQREYHPDRFANQSDQQKCAAVRLSAFINEAHEILKSPVKRALYLLQLRGFSVDLDRLTIADKAFLYQQLEWLETLAELSAAPDPEALLNKMKSDVTALFSKNQHQFAEAYHHQQWAQAAMWVAHMQFLMKLLHDIEQREELFLD